MALKLIYITNSPEIALIAESNGVDRVMVDLETLGKEERQKNMNTVKSHHTIEDVRAIAGKLKKSELLVRVNPWNENSLCEIESVITAGADRIMLPMWKNTSEVDEFLQVVNNRTKTTLLLETKEAVECIDEVLKNPLLDEIHIGLNDLHLSYGKTFMFELLSDGTVEHLCQKMKNKGICYGFGGVARIGQGTLYADRIVMEHYRLGSSVVILSRSFCNADEIGDITKIKQIFKENVSNLRDFERTLEKKDASEFEENRLEVCKGVNYIVEYIKGNKI